VTMSDVANLLKQEREKNPKEPRLFVRKPPYPIELLKQPYPEKYVAQTFSCFDGQKGSALVHISKFIDSMRAYAGNGDLCLREFSKSFDDRAYTWYTTLPPGSVKVWKDMVKLFCGKYFQAEEKNYPRQPPHYKANKWGRLAPLYTSLSRNIFGLLCQL
jgi:hypothetical protein